MFVGLLDSRRHDTSPGDTPTVSLICHPVQVGVMVLFVTNRWHCRATWANPNPNPADAYLLVIL